MDTLKLTSPATRQFWEIPVLFEDEHLLALNKPAGLLTSPDQALSALPSHGIPEAQHGREALAPPLPSSPPTGASGGLSLVQLLHRDVARGATWALERKAAFLAPTHRLDAEIGGVLLLAKSKPVLSAIASQFGTEKPLKSFVALIRGAPVEETFEVDAKVARDPRQPGLMRVSGASGRKARTLFQVVERFTGCALLKCQPLTDRPQQVRAHLKSRRLPVMGDAPYGGSTLLLSRLKPGYRLKPDRTERPLISTPALHLEELHIVHPVTGAPVTILAPWPKDLTVAVKYLRRYASAVSTADNGPAERLPE